MIANPALAVPAIAVGAGLLWKGADWLVAAAARLARGLGMSDLTIGLTVVALGTSLPEFVVTLVAAFSGKADLAVGNVVGSNIFNTGLILGLCALAWGLPVPRILPRRDIPVLAIGTAALLLYLNDLRLAHWEGALMFTALVIYVVCVFFFSSVEDLDAAEVPAGQASGSDAFWVLVGLCSVGLGAHLLVSGAQGIADLMGVPTWLVGVTVVAAGTSLPELVTSIAAARHGHTGMIAGNVIGSDAFNLLGVMGLAACIHPLKVGPEVIPGIWMMLGSCVLLLIVCTRSTLGLPAGIALIGVALGRWAYEILAAMNSG